MDWNHASKTFEEQVGLVTARQISDGIMVAHQTVRLLHHPKRVVMIVKLDVKKAYDQVDWAFVDKVMQKFVFSNDWMKWIQRYIFFLTYSIVINEILARYLQSSMWLYQKDLVSPCLFIILAESYDTPINKAHLDSILR